MVLEIWKRSTRPTITRCRSAESFDCNSPVLTMSCSREEFAAGTRRPTVSCGTSAPACCKIQTLVDFSFYKTIISDAILIKTGFIGLGQTGRKFRLNVEEECSL